MKNKRITHLFIEVLRDNEGWFYVPVKKGTFDEVSFNPLMGIERNYFTPFNNVVLPEDTEQELKDKTDGIMWYYIDLADIDSLVEFFNQDSDTYKCLIKGGSIMVGILTSMYGVDNLPTDFKHRIRLVYGVYKNKKK